MADDAGIYIYAQYSHQAGRTGPYWYGSEGPPSPHYTHTHYSNQAGPHLYGSEGLPSGLTARLPGWLSRYIFNVQVGHDTADVPRGSSFHTSSTRQPLLSASSTQFPLLRQRRQRSRIMTHNLGPKSRFPSLPGLGHRSDTNARAPGLVLHRIQDIF